MADVTGLDVSPGDEVVIIGSQGDDRIDVREMAAIDRHDPVGARLPGRQPDRTGLRVTGGSGGWESVNSNATLTRRSPAPEPPGPIDQSNGQTSARPSSSVRSAARSRRSGSAAAPTAAPGTRSSKSGRPRRGGAPARPPLRAGRRRRRRALYADIELAAARAPVDRRSTSSIACSAAASCPGRWCCSAASRASASRRCCCRRRRTWRAPIGPVLYSSGEESEHQIKSRGERLGGRRRAALSAGRDLPRAHSRRDRPASSRRWSSSIRSRRCSR